MKTTRLSPLGRRRNLTCGATALLLATAVSYANAAEFVLSDFNGTGFDYTFSEFNQSVGATSVRLTDPNDGWGGAGVTPPDALDLSSLPDGRLVVDFIPEAGNSTSDFSIELIERISGSQTQTSGKWTFDLAGLQPGVPARAVSTTPLSQPSSGLGEFQNLDLSSIRQWQVLGSFGSDQPFDVSFDRIAVSTEVAAPGAYVGSDPGAAWRAEAATRIEAHRMADLNVSVVDAAGLPVPNARVDVAMQRHEFGFGSAVQARRLRDNNPQNDRYKEQIVELFNVATLENNLKWQPWEGEWGDAFTQQGALDALDWLSGEEIDARGHVLVWPGRENLPADIRAMLDDGDLTTNEQQAVRNRIANHIASIGAATSGKLVAWDVINETRTNNDLMRELAEGDQAMVEWFRLAREAAPNTRLYMNDFGILNTWGRDRNRDQYFETIEQLLQSGAEIDGVGFQAHFGDESLGTPSDLPGPVEVWQILDRFAELGLDMQITEFDVRTNDEQVQADYTRDFLTAVFAHEGISEFLVWGFWEEAIWRRENAMFRSDWSIKPNGQAYMDLVFDEWWTDETLDTDASGEATLRAFKGDHRITVTVGGKAVVRGATLTDGGGEISIRLATVVGDYNADGVVDAADYTVWREATVTQDLSADGNNDGVVNTADFQLWASRYGATATGPTLPVPEPSTALPLAAFALRPRR